MFTKNIFSVFATYALTNSAWPVLHRRACSNAKRDVFNDTVPGTYKKKVWCGPSQIKP